VGALTDVLSKWPRTEVPAALLVAWAVWILGGLLLMLWFTRRSAAPREHALTPRPSGAVRRRRSSVHAAARQASTVLSAAAQNPAPRSSSAVRVPDAYSELSSLLDSTNDPPAKD
jgi:hypothetical protein